MSSSPVLDISDGLTFDAEMPSADMAAPSPADLVQAAMDPGILLPGEDPDSVDPADAVRWVRVYRDLIELTTVLLERTESALKQMAGDAIREATVDQRLL
ncbi:MAG: hypothetical protein ACHQ4F_16330, partial [Candidatus Dormibacteria bacterium]